MVGYYDERQRERETGYSQPRSIHFSGEDPSAPSAWSTPPQEIAAFAAMLGKQWLNRYLRHASGSNRIERCGAASTNSRNGHSDNSSRVSPPCSRCPFSSYLRLPRYMLSVNTSVALVVIAPPSFLLHWDCDRRCALVRTPVPNADIDDISQFSFAGILPLGALPHRPW